MFLLALGATARLTRFVNADFLSRGIRVAAIKKWGPDHDVPYGLGCAFCMSIWIGAGVYAAAYFYGHTAAYVITTGALTASWLYAVIAGWFDPVDGNLARALGDEGTDE